MPHLLHLCSTRVGQGGAIHASPRSLVLAVWVCGACPQPQSSRMPTADTPQIHKPSAWVSFGLPDPLSFQVRSHAMVARRSGTNTRQGKRQGQAAKQPDPLSWKCNARITKIKAQEGKGEPDIRLYVLDTVDGHAQPGQYGCHHCRLGRGSARPSGRQAVRGWASSQDIGNRLGTGCKNISGSFFPLCCGQPSGRANPLRRTLLRAACRAASALFRCRASAQNTSQLVQ